ncbi:uncharacterized protein LOC128206972 [Mya arenaria]|uniref:uncharacterized protein LOC128206972 n=1 Tax=Mya arenaria TaxID=6604 RepID=UPI0022E6FA5E|nr:uncharacterized protein LOC128206972 [Mya arenaria]
MAKIVFCFLCFLSYIQGEVLSLDTTRQIEIFREVFQKEINHLNGKIISLEGKYNDLNGAFKDLEGENKELRNELHVLKADKSTTAEEPVQKDPDIALDNTSPRKGLLVPKRAANGEIVAFHAKLHSSKCFQPHDIIVFDNVVTNNANAYDGSDGIFTAPISGTYVFIWNFSSMESSDNVLELVVHGAGIGSSISDSAHNTGDSHPAAGIAVVNVEVGQRVFVRKLAGNGIFCELLSNYGYFITTFSGWLLS